MTELKDTFNLKPNNLSSQEKEWLKNLIKFSFSMHIKSKDIIFTTQNGDHSTYYFISPKFLKEYDEQSIPRKFLREKYIIKGISGLNRNDDYFVDICFIYWYFNNIDDYLDFLDIWNEIFDSVFACRETFYDKEVKGYKVLPEHLQHHIARWSVIRKTFLIGFGIYIGLFQRETVPSLEEIFLGLKNKTLKLIGISKAHGGSFGMVSHYEKLKRCWNCGNMIDAPGGLCEKCYDYWDEKTK
ncbi:MAG: hypothetical protein EAX90_15480 [Candidatus Heimdallarchaeota archaeon]|nr:hypothetical protein [Candidatus Heimdallarchaeota archaeon]